MNKKLRSIYHLGALLLFVLGLMVSNVANAQCPPSTSNYGNGAAPTTAGSPYVVNCTFYGEYASISSMSSASVYNISATGISPFVTIRDAAGTTVVASGNLPMTFTPPVTGTYQLHWNGAGCTTDFNCHNATIAYVGPSSACSNPVLPGTTTSTPAAACPGQNFTLALSGVSTGTGLTYQWQSSPTGAVYTNISGATSVSFSASQTVATYYQCVVTCSAGTPAVSVPVQVNMSSFLNCYCASSAQFAFDEDILNVTLSTLNNTSTCSTTGGPGSAQGLYSNYTALPAPILAQGVTYPMSVLSGTCGGFYDNGIKVWVDFNQNGLFTDPGENVYNPPTPTNGVYTANFTINIPLTATLGLTRMRVVQQEIFGSTAGISPCGNYSYGETEDYFVNIAAAPSCAQPTNFALVSANLTTADLTWDNTPGTWEVQYGPIGFAVGTGTTVSGIALNSTTLLGLTSNSFYSSYVRRICGSAVGDTSFWSGPVNFNTYDQAAFMETNTDCPIVGFIDIATSGTDLNLTDDSNAGVTLPFPVLMQGVLYNNMTVGNNGGLQLGTTSAFIGYGGNFNTLASGTLFAWGDDMDAQAGNVYWEAVGTAPNRTLVVQWDNSCNYPGNPSAPVVTFEIQIHEATNEIYYVYDDVVFGAPNAFDDYAANADLGLSGVNQDFTVSSNNSNYLTDNSCVHFYYVDCPNPSNLIVDYVFSTEVSLSWAAGLFGETNWTVIYDTAGFDPSIGGTTLTYTTTNAVIPGLTQNTAYDFYVFADCAIGTSQSNGLLASATTLPYCSDPSSISTATAIDSVFSTWNWVADPSGLYPISNFNMEYGVSGYIQGTGTTVSSGTNLSDTTVSATLLSGGVYELYIQAVCGIYSSNPIGPISFTMPLENDSICESTLLLVDGSLAVFNNFGATVQSNETTIAPPATGAQQTDGWINSNLSKTTWFKFAAPASGQVRISGADQGFDGQMAVYSAISCSPIDSLDLIAANDNEIDGPSLAPNFTVCGLTPGVQYYLMHDSYTTATGIYSIRLTEIVLNAGSTSAQIDVCVGDTVDLFSGIAGYNLSTGTWLDIDNTLHVNGSMFNSGGLVSGIYDFDYELVDGCATDVSSTTVKIFSLPQAGTDGVINICKNEPTSLLNGLTGTFTLGGAWSNPQNAATNVTIDLGELPNAGQFNYKYVIGNGVCPNDTSVVTVNVSQSCDYLGLDDLSVFGIKLFPNPTNDVLNIETQGLAEALTLQLVDMNGKVIWNGAMLPTNSSIQVDLSTYDQGIYILKLNDSNASVNYRVVKN